MKSTSIENSTLTNLTFSFFPISLILGNLITNINIVFFCCLGIFYLRSKIITTKLDISIKIIFLFFLLILFSTCFSFFKSIYFQEYSHTDLTQLVKSVLFLRFFLMLIIVYLLSEFDILNFKYFLISTTLALFFVSMDIIYQYNFGVNIVGFKSVGVHNSSFFGDELIAGGFLQKFSFFAIFFVAFSLRHKNNLRFLATVFAVCILGLGILLSGNRMPLTLFIFGLLLILFFKIKFKKTILGSFLALLVILAVVISSDKARKGQYMSYYSNVKQIVLSTFGKKIELNEEEVSKVSENEETKPEPLDVIQYVWERFTKPPKWKEGEFLKDDFEHFWVLQNEIDSHTKIYLTALDTWEKNKVFGNGIKSFAQDCQKLLIHKTNRLCSNHPHNYYLEILTETGIVGILIVFTLAIIFVFFIYKNFRFLNENSLESLVLFVATISLFLEVFPIKSTGSIFTTGNATYIILLASILISHKKLLNTTNSI